MARILLDECVDRRLARHITGHEVRTVHGLGWSGISDAALLRRAVVDFDIFVTVDQHLPQQQNLKQLRLAVVLLRPIRARLPELLELVPALLAAIPNAQPGAVVELGRGGTT